jgi:hypothetical protein
MHKSALRQMKIRDSRFEISGASNYAASPIANAF